MKNIIKTLKHTENTDTCLVSGMCVSNLSRSWTYYGNIIFK